MKFKISCLCIAIASMIASAEPAKTTKFGDIKLDTDVNVELISKGTIDGEKIITSKDLLLYEQDNEKINALETKVNAVETKSTELNTKVDGLDQRITEISKYSNYAGTTAYAILIPYSSSLFTNTIIEYKDAFQNVKPPRYSLVNFKIKLKKYNSEYNKSDYDLNIKFIEIISDRNNVINKIDNDILYSSGNEGDIKLKIISDENIEITESFYINSVKLEQSLMYQKFLEKDNTFRLLVQQNILNKFKLVDTSKVTSFQRCRAGLSIMTEDGKILQGANVPFMTKQFPNQVHLYGNNGDNKPVRAIPIANTNFFWPELADNLRFCSIEKSPGPWASSIFEKHMISPHYYIAAVHCFWPFCPYSQFCIDRKNQKFISLGFSSDNPDDTNRWDQGNYPIAQIGDLGIYKFNKGEFPKELCMKFCREDLFKKLSDSEFKHTLYLRTTAHNTVAPEFNSGLTEGWLNYKSTMLSWMTTDDKKILDKFYHNAHTGDSSRLTFYPMPNGKVIPTSILHYGNGYNENCLINNEIINFIKTTVEKDSNGKETIQLWTENELLNN